MPVTDTELDITSFVEMGAPALIDVDRILAVRDFQDETVSSFAGQPDIPRNVEVTLLDTNSSVVSGYVTVYGISATGKAISEVFRPTPGGGSQTVSGKKMFAQVTKVVTVDVSGATGSDDYTVGMGNVIGLPMNILSAEAVSTVYFNGAIIASPTITVGENSSGIDVSSSTYDGTKQLRAIVQRGK